MAAAMQQAGSTVWRPHMLGGRTRFPPMQAASEEWALQLDGRGGSAELANSLQRPSFSAPARGKSLGLGSARSGMLQQARVRLRTLNSRVLWCGRCMGALGPFL